MNAVGRTIRKENYSKVRTVDHRVLFCIIRAQLKRQHYRMTLYDRALQITLC